MTATALTPVNAAHLTPANLTTATANIDASNGNSAQVADPTRTVLVVRTASTAGSIAFAYAVSPDGQTISAPAQTLAASSVYVFANWPPGFFGGTVTWTYPTPPTGTRVDVVSI